MGSNPSIQPGAVPGANGAGLNPANIDPALMTQMIQALQQSGTTLPGIDPQLQAQALAALQNPNAGDGFAPGMPGGAPGEGGGFNPVSMMMPGSKKDWAISAAMGAGVGAGLQVVHHKNGLVRLAQFVDKHLPFAKQINGFLTKHIVPHLKKSAWTKELFLLYDNLDDAGVDDALLELQKRHLKTITEAASKIENLDKSVLTKLKSIDKFDDYAVALKEVLENPTNLTRGGRRTIRGMFRRITHSLDAYKHVTKAELELAKKLKDVGPIGRMIGSIELLFVRTLGGETLATSAKSIRGSGAGKAVVETATDVAESSWLSQKLSALGNTAVGQKLVPAGKFTGKLIGPAINGLFVFSHTIDATRKAKKDEKVKTFFHALLGNGLGMFIGMEIGRKLMNAINPGKLLGKLSYIPVPFGTLGGLIIEVAASFLFASIAQKAFERFSHGIFGKPSEESLHPEKFHKPKLDVPATADGQPLERANRFASALASGRQATPAGTTPPFPQRPNVADSHGQAAKPAFSITPEEIVASAAAQRHQAETNEVLSMPWNSHNTFNPFGH